jgi:hypothetical protein
MRIIDAHVHLGDGPHKAYPLERLQGDLRDAGAEGAVIFAFPEDMYRVVDSHESRVAANNCVLEAAKRDTKMYPFYFVWNDYFIPDDFDEFVGIKWHRHHDEPRYDYTKPECEAILERIRARKMPVTLEEEFEHTLAFVDRNPGLPIIIPHCGLLNGGTRRMTRFFDLPHVHFDTAVASWDNLAFVAERVPPERIIFGSDVSGTSQPFYNFTKVELEKVRKLAFNEEEMGLVLAGNIDRLVAQVVT